MFSHDQSSQTNDAAVSEINVGTKMTLETFRQNLYLYPDIGL